MWKKYYLCLSLEMCLMAFLIICSANRRAGEETAARIAPEILRFHVLANSNSSADQALKLEVKDLLLEEIRSGAETAARALKKDSLTKDELCAYIRKNKEDLSREAEYFMAARGYNYPAEILLEQCSFPEKTYGDMTFPAGTYDAVRVLIGEGEGRNFWCVLYPSLCYLDSAYAVVPDESKSLLKTLIAEEDFQAMMTARHLWFTRKKTPQNEKDSLPQVHIKLKLTEILTGK